MPFQIRAQHQFEAHALWQTWKLVRTKRNCLFCMSEAKTTNHNHFTDGSVFLLVEFLVENSANIKKPNYNGGTCLINSVQSVKLCSYLISKGADVNAKDIQNKTALHYAIQEHRYVQLKLFRFLQIHSSKFIWNLIEILFFRLETTKLLLDAGADQFAKSKNGDDALQIACLKGAHDIFRHLIERIPYSKERLASANELIGENNENVHVFFTLKYTSIHFNFFRINLFGWTQWNHFGCSTLERSARNSIKRLWLHWYALYYIFIMWFFNFCRFFTQPKSLQCQHG